MSVSPGEKEEVERVEGVTFFKTCYTTELRHPPDAQGAGVVLTPKVLELHLNTRYEILKNVRLSWGKGRRFRQYIFSKYFKLQS